MEKPEVQDLIDKTPAYMLYSGKINDIKVLIKKPAHKDSVAKCRREIEILQDLGNREHIVNLLGHFIDDSLPFEDTYSCYAMMSCNLQNALLNTGAQNIDVDTLLISMAYILAYIHEKGYMHRDIKSANIFLDSGGKAHLGGFDLACKYSSVEELTPETGTYRWMAPEIIRHEPYDNSADVYSFGILMFECYTREIPYSNMTAITAAYSVAKENFRPTVPTHVNPRKKAIMKRCWLDDPASRPPFEDLIGLLKCI